MSSSRAAVVELSTTVAPVTIALDAMGGDYAPQETVKGAVEAARRYGVAILLVGQPEIIQQELNQYDTTGLQLSIVEARETIDMDETPAQAVRKKKQASIVVAARLVKEGKAQALVAAGSTGAAMTAAALYIGRIPGVERPAIAVTLPSLGTPCLLIDAGANADCDPALLVQFAHMGQVFMRGVYGIADPEIGLLNIGTEECKGNLFAKAAFDLLREAANDEAFPFRFVGNVEGRHLFLGGCDVAVCDGFTGNVALKSAEGVLSLFGKLLKRELTASPWRKLVGLLVKPAVQAVRRQIDHEELGGALLLGINGICVIAHGGSSANAIHNAVRVAKQACDNQVVPRIQAVYHHQQQNSATALQQSSDPAENVGAAVVEVGNE